MPYVVDCSQAPPGGAWAYPYPGERVELCGPACTGLDETCYPEPPFERHETTVTWDCE